MLKLKLKLLTPTILALALLTSCTHMNSTQKRELQEWQAKNLEVKEKDPTTAAVLNILPGFGDFYNGQIGLGVANLLLWPLSVAWAPFGGATGAQEVNYFATKAYVEELEVKKKKLKNEVEVAFIGKQISREEFYLANKKIEAMNLTEFKSNIEVKDVLPFDLDKMRQPTSTDF